jgi:hypothetical protein
LDRRRINHHRSAHFEQVHLARRFGASNLVKTPFELSRWRGGRYACDTPDIMGSQSVLNRLSPLFANSLSFSLLQAKVDSISIA